MNIITNERSKYWTGNSKCQFCNLNENVIHRYFECDITESTWKTFYDIFHINYNLDWKKRIILPTKNNLDGNIKSIIKKNS